MSSDSPVQLLVVEDEPANLVLLRAVVSSATDARLRTATIREAMTLAEGHAALETSVPDILVLDVRLPDGDGLTLARGLASKGTPLRPKVLVLSASVLHSERDAAISAGGDLFLGKPYRPAQLVEALQLLMEPAAT